MIAVGRCNILHIPFWDYIYFEIIRFMEYNIKLLNLLLWCLFEIYVCMCVCVCTYKCVGMQHECAHGGQTLTSDIFLSCFLPWLLRQGVSLNRELTDLTRMNSQKSEIASHFQLSSVIKHKSYCTRLLCIAARDSDPQIVQPGLYWPTSLCHHPNDAFCAFFYVERMQCVPIY